MNHPMRFERRLNLKVGALRPLQPSRGIILLVVLGMLALFSLLTATYIIFTARSRQASIAIGRREVRSIDTRVLLRDTIAQVLVGPPTNNSSFFSHSLLEDYYGRDFISGKVINTNAQDPDGLTTANPNPYNYLPAGTVGLPFGPEVMLGRGDGALRTAQYLKFPIQLRDLSANPTNAMPAPYNVEDALVGRHIVFTEGPMQGLLLEVVRSFGHIPGTDPAVGNRNSVVVDLGPHLEHPITINGVTELLRDWLPRDLTVGPYLQDINSRSLIYNRTALPQLGLRFRVTPRPRNGRGFGWQVATGGNAYNLNQTFSPAVDAIDQTIPFPQIADVPIPVSFQGNHKYLNFSNGLPYIPTGDADEAVDIPDYHDYLLGYFPPATNAPMVGLTAPSGIRPAMLNYLLHYFDAVPGTLNPASWTVPQRLSLLRMLQRASLRPIPVINGGGFDVSGGEFATFTGSNNAPANAIRQPIDVARLTTNGAAGVQEALHLASIYQQLIFGPWDVDNDGDGLVDSVWIDAGMGLITMPDGALVRPMVAVRIEDLDNRLDVNAVDSASSVVVSNGNVTNQARANQFTGVFAGAGVNTTAVELAGGFGVGPAEIVMQGLFRQNRAASLIRARYGTDGAPGRLASAVSATPTNPFWAGNDTLSVWGSMGRSPFHSVSLAQLFVPANNNFTKVVFPTSQFGMPIDLHGRAIMALDPFGQPILNPGMLGRVILPTGVNLSDDATDHPYEMQFSATSGADAALSVAELEPVLRYRDWDRNEMPGRLRGLIDQELTYDEATSGNVRINDDAAINRSTLSRAVTTISDTDAAPSTSIPPEHSIPASGQAFDYQNQAYDPTTRLALNLLIQAQLGETPSDAKFEALLPLEVRRGQRLNLNRPLGNGFNLDNIGGTIAQRIPPLANLTVDETAELLAQTEAIFNQPSPNDYEMFGDFTSQTGRPIYGGSGFDPEQLPTFENWSAQQQVLKIRNEFSRAELARHLYVMTMLLISKRTGLTNFDAYDFRYDTSSNDEDEVRARRVAQWAVNVVDFRDRDAIYTRFEYDPNPLDGWDEDPTVVDDVTTVVWGNENPDLLLTEVFSMHDRRVIDSDRDAGQQATRFDGSNFVDDDMDQARVPQGSTYIELYATRGPKGTGNGSDNHHTPPPELYNLLPRSFLDNNPNNDNIDELDVVPVLDLGRLAPDGNPVWRIGISDIQLPVGAVPNPLDELQSMAAGTWDDLTFDPTRNLRYSNAVNANFRFDRIVWFGNIDPRVVGNALPTDSRFTTQWNNALLADEHHRVFFNRFASTDYRGGVVAGLEGGQYAVVGPRRRTYVGSMAYSQATGPISFADYVPFQVFDLHPQMQNTFTPGFQAYVPTDNNGTAEATLITPAPFTSARSIVPILAAAEPPASWGNANNTAPNGIGINISEPLPRNQYYTEPTDYMNSDHATDNLNLTGYALDSFFDYQNPASPPSLPDQPFDSRPGAPLAGLENTGTRDNFRTAYLQRLADPTQRYHPRINPYMTVDWMPMDLTVFNGEDDNNEQLGPDLNGAQEWIDPTDNDPFGAGIPDQFASRSKNGIGVNPDGTTRFTETDHVIWSYGTQPPTVSTRFSIGGAYVPNYPMVVVHRQDWNTGYVPSTVYAGNPATANANSFSMGYLNHAFGTRYVPGQNFAQNEMWVGAPSGTPFPWLGFMNRDYASPLELMLVPASSPDRLMLEFSLPGNATPMPYTAKTQATDSDDVVEKEFGHLLNFFVASDDVELAPNFYRLFDFVETPDPFIDSKELLDPIRLRGAETARELDAMGVYYPPFNFVTKDQRAGRVNLNTVNNPLVWRGLMWMHSRTSERVAGQAGAFWNEWMLSRRGYGTINSPALDPEVPTQFRGALRSSDTAWIAPQVKNPALSLRLPGVQGGLLRLTADPANAANSKTAFTRTADPVSTGNERDQRRNPFFRYQTLMRMPNLVADNSNTYSVWVTIGFFQIDPATLQVGQEYGIQEGTNVRPKAFYIIDRSVPVDFVPGQETDSRKTILLERILD